MDQLPAREQAKIAVDGQFRAELEANATLAIVQEVSAIDRLLAAIDRLSTLVSRGQPYQDWLVIQVGATPITQRRQLRHPGTTMRLRRLQLWTNTGFAGAGATVLIEGLTPEPLELTLSTGIPQVLQLEWLLPPQPITSVRTTNISGSAGTITVTLECEAIY
jgi:hypothetical protein